MLDWTGLLNESKHRLIRKLKAFKPNVLLKHTHSVNTQACAKACKHNTQWLLSAFSLLSMYLSLPSLSFFFHSLSEYFSIDEPITDDNTVQCQHPFPLSLSLSHAHSSRVGLQLCCCVLLCISVCVCLNVCVSSKRTRDLTSWHQSSKLQ